MKISNCTSCNVNFGYGLSKNILEQEKQININKHVKFFEHNFIETNFLNNKGAVLANKFCMKIINDFVKIIGGDFIFPPAIFLYKKHHLIDTSETGNFCIPDTKEVLKNDSPFAGRSIFFNDFTNLTEIDTASEQLYHKKISSCSHFLAPFLHEWLHSLHLHYIYSKLGYGGDCKYLNEIYPLKTPQRSGVVFLREIISKKLTEKENEIVFDTLGEYSTRPFNQYLEIFTETFTKYICMCLKDCKLVQNPFEKIKETSPEFQKILTKVIIIK